MSNQDVMGSDGHSERVNGLLALLRGETSYEAVAQRFGVSVAEIRAWELVFIQDGANGLEKKLGDQHESESKTDLAIGSDIVTDDTIHDTDAVIAVSQSLAAILDLGELLDATLDILHVVYNYTPTIYFLENSDLVFKGGYSLRGGKLEPDDPRLRLPMDGERNISAWSAVNWRPVNVQNTHLDPRFSADDLIGPTLSELAIPIIFKTRVLGILNVRSASENAFGPNDISLLETISFQLASAIENARLFEAVQRQLAQLTLLQSVTAKAIQDLDAQTVLNFTAQTIQTLMGYQMVSIGLVAEKRQYLDIVATAGPPEVESANHGKQIPLDVTTFLGRSVLEDRLIRINNVARANLSLSRPLWSSSQSELVVPIRSGKVIIGVIDIASDRPDSFDDTAVATMIILADQLVIALRGANLFKQTQLQLRQIQIFRRLADEAIVGVITRDINGIIEYANPTAALLLGYTNAEALRGASIQALYADENWQSMDKEICISAMRNDGWSGEIEQRRGDQPVVRDVSVFPIYAPDDAFMTYGMVLLDATERHRLLEVIQRANTRFEAILEASDDGIILWDETRRILIVNAAASRLLGLAAEQLIGRSRAEWSAYPSLVAVAEAEEDERIELPGHRVARCRNLRLPSNRIAGHVTMIYDVTSHAQLEEYREAMISMLVHDLLAPVTSMVGGIEMSQSLLVENEQRERILHYLDMAHRNGSLLLDLASSLLDINRLEAGRMKLDYAPLQIDTLIEEVRNILSGAAQAAGINVRVMRDSALPLMKADNMMLRRAMGNLLDNAIKFSPDNSEILIAVTCGDNNAVSFSVSDRGPGVPEAYRKRLFEKYSQVPDQPARREGNGLGLVFCRLVAEAHGGFAKFEMRPGGGSIFSITIASGQAFEPAPSSKEEITKSIVNQS
jgi:PAS domain S-box-containing protein